MVWLIVFLWFEKQLLLSGLRLGKFIFLASLPFLFLFLIAVFSAQGIFQYSVEPLIVAYYILFALSLTTNSWKLQAAALLLCLLSRYSVVLWLPLFFAVLYLKDKKAPGYKIIAFLALGFLVLYAPFLMVDYTIFQQGYEHHSGATLSVWQPQHWQVNQSRPDLLYRGYGMAWFAYENFAGDLAEKIKTYKSLHLALSLFTVFVSGLFFLKIKNKIDYRIFLVGALKIYIVVFTHFLQMPFDYLYILPIFMSIPLLHILLTQKTTTVT